jgi:predicted DNA-binding protein (MmcQ/YjbR family)
MNAEQVREFCLRLPGAREDIKWGGARVFSIAGNKMFAVQHINGTPTLGFKVDQSLFLGYCDRPGIHPAPYLARAYWISLTEPYAASATELTELLSRSHQLVVGKLPKRQQIGLLL